MSSRLKNEDFVEKKQIYIVWLLKGPALPFFLPNTHTYLVIRTILPYMCKIFYTTYFTLHVSERRLWKKGAFLIAWLSETEAKEPNFFLVEVGDSVTVWSVVGIKVAGIALIAVVFFSTATS